MTKKKKVGLALSGGGARGFAHLGVVKALHEKGIFPEVFSGTSAGALVGVFLANGRDPVEIFNFLKDRKILDVTKLVFPKSGLLNMTKVKKELERELAIKDLKETKYPFYVCVSNITKGKVEYLCEGPAIDLIIASASIPVLFSPVKINGDLYSDGGIFDNLPVKPIRELCDIVIGVHINPVHEVNNLSNLIQIASRTFHLTVNNNVAHFREMCDIWIEPEDLDNFEILGFKKFKEIFDLGYEYVRGMGVEGLGGGRGAQGAE